MVPDDGFTAHCLELLAPHGAARARRMFGGVGIYLDGLFIALIADERLYLKVDARPAAPSWPPAANPSSTTARASRSR